MGFGEVAKDEEEEGPDDAKEDNAEDTNLPGVGVLGAPEDCNTLG